MPLTQRTTPHPHWEFSAAAGGDLLRLVPERGGLLSGWRCNGRELLYLDEARFADPALSVRGGMPVLFPICGNLPADQLPLPQGVFTLKQHGFARDLPWDLEELPGAVGVRLTLSDSSASQAMFPFPFRLQLELRPVPGGLAITVELHNPGVDPLPFAFGLHPYFAVTSLAMASLEGLPERCFDHGTMAPAATTPLLEGLEQGVDLLAQPAGPVRLLDRQAGVVLELQAEAPFDLAVVWSDPPRSMVCLEPWTAPRGALVSGERRLEVAPGESCRLACRYQLLEGAEVSTEDPG
ncbi:galactose mutarotase [Synechococcus sp. 1G10]|uniref:aldose epimerase family protein n=1 Tax=Synechococcus sp. 1G10 TaxID=2025605 RepID=UPI000B9830AF|nr:galactose mutarotase [Synechococcus sp. 1G10]